MTATIVKGSNWLGDYSRLTYSEAKRYLAMLKEQGKEVLDDEFNVMQDMALTFIRRLQLDFMGDGAGGDGFKIVGIGANNDFSITGGASSAGGALAMWAGGLRMQLPASITYLTQENAPPILTTPGANRSDTVYLDLWLDELGPSGDANMVDPTLSIETSRRLKLNYKVLVAEGSGSAPPNYTDGNGQPHFVAVLATINRTATAQITAPMIVDRRTKLQNFVSRLGDSMLGLLLLSGDPVAALGAVTKQYADANDLLRVLKAGDTMTGPLVLPGNPVSALQAVPKQYADANDLLRVLKAGDTMTGPLVLPGNPVAALAAVPKQYVDTFFAPLASPALTGVPTAPTPSGSVNDGTIATMAALWAKFVSSDGASGSFKIPKASGGSIMVTWFSFTPTRNVAQSYNFPLSFPNNCWGLVAFNKNSSSNQTTAEAGVQTSNFAFSFGYTTAASANDSFFVIAIGD